MAYVYEHWRPDTNQPFWVGKGTGSRARLVARCNRHHRNIVQKLAALLIEVRVQIVADGLSEEAAFALERERIAFWRSCGIELANQSIGGRGGMQGCRRSKESCAKQSAATIGRKRTLEQSAKSTAWLRSPEGRATISKIHSGRKRSKETAKNISLGVKRSWADPEIRARHLSAIPEQVFSEETRAKMRAAKTPEARARISEAVKKQWDNPEFRKLVSDTMRKTNLARKAAAACAK